MPHSYCISKKAYHQQPTNLDNPRLSDLPLLSVEQYEEIIFKRPMMIDGIANMMNLAMVYQKCNKRFITNDNFVSGGNTV
ncbi:hypothetical protein [Xenorhabdus griffiniae]|uniref:Uncharacterized protein n=1 Tax=Xenorhabdus griffiniae TaxID=351672 RepID=A0ABY9XEU3_9GAMM|nr:hypothetical protein [Xenorhabdus griffiniae]MBD1225990.1 hypothetical protein [Xenorhabdus griffiniae]MBE8585892.1 hypothetical protein [Xenorhabdus griffiniae]WMV71436.1 hypothetical protein QL128_14845 [Xenorhabdus griffiniae]WNH01113.1 hypothetical protein QL112_014850 [Xenorhabdus griffiniae]